MQFLSGLGIYIETPNSPTPGFDIEASGNPGVYRAPTSSPSLAGVGRYFETRAAASRGERFEVTGVDDNYRVPVDGVGRYFETPAAYAAGERFDIVGAEGDYQAPVAGVAGMGRYYEDSYGIKNDLGPFRIQSANEVYKAPEWGMGDLDAKGPGGVDVKITTNPVMWILLGAAGGIFVTHLMHSMKRR